MTSNNNQDTLRDQVADWMSVLEEDGACAIIVTSHKMPSGDERQICEMKPGSPQWGKPDEMANVIWLHAQRTARGLVGYQQFEVAAAFGQQQRPTRFLPFGITGQLQLGPGGGGTASGAWATEGPTGIGQVAQVMRLMEALVQGSFQDRKDASQVILHAYREAMGDNQNLRRENAELWLGMKNLLMDLMKQSHEMRMKEIAAARMAEFQKQAMKLAPAIINSLSDREVFPQSSEDTSLIEFAAEYISPEQFQGVMGMLAAKPNTEQLRAALTARYNRYQEKKGAEKTEEKRLMNEYVHRTYDEGERDAQGEAVKVLRGKPPAPKHTVDIKQLNGTPIEPAAVEPSVETAPVEVVEAAPADDVKEGAEALDELLTRLRESGQAELMFSMLGAQDPELAKRLRKRYGRGGA